jgi:hypothetical protein
VVVATSAFAFAATFFATSHGPLPAHTGGFAEATCQRCHAEYPLNEGVVRIALDSLPGFFESNRAYPLRLRVQHPELKRGGFQLSARFEDGSNAGGFTVSDTTILKLQRSRDVQYLSHNIRGTYQLRGDTAEWRFTWVAPPAQQRVVFHVAVNVANDDASEFGDRIFTATFHAGGEPVRK